jgi:hypothetical protein
MSKKVNQKFLFKSFNNYFYFLVVLSLNSAISTFKPDVQEMMKNFTGFAELWEKVKILFLF